MTNGIKVGKGLDWWVFCIQCGTHTDRAKTWVGAMNRAYRHIHRYHHRWPEGMHGRLCDEPILTADQRYTCAHIEAFYTPKLIMP